MIINIVDATTLERSLYLTLQILELDCKVIVALNMCDMLDKKGLKLDVEKLQEFIGTSIVKISALKDTGINDLIEKIENSFSKKQQNIYDSNIENSILQIQNELDNKLSNKRFTSVKILEGDKYFKEYNNSLIKLIVEEASKKYDTDLEEIIAEERYLYIQKLKKECVKKQKTKITISDKLDKIFLNKWISLPIFIFIMFVLYYLSVGVVGKFTADWITEEVELFKNLITNLLQTAKVSDWIISLITNGIITGVSEVLKFIPQLIILFLCMEILEATGYMARISLLLDRVFRKIGLSGKSLIPFILGSGCSVPGVMGSRIIKNEEQRKMTIILTPFIPCSAKLPIIALFSGYFFNKNSGLASFSLYFLSISIIILFSFLMKKFIFKNTSESYIFELPEYKKPNIKYIIKEVHYKTKEFVKRAGSIILVCSTIIWFLLSFSTKFIYGVGIENSILASLGKKISWMFYPMLGVNSWEAAVSSIQGLIAKEQVISSMAVISKLSGNSMFEQNGIFSFFTPTSAYAFMVFNLFSAPCIGAISAMRKELGGIKETLAAILFQTLLAWNLASIIYRIGNKIEKGKFNMSNIAIIAMLLILITVIYKKRKNLRCKQCKSCKTN